jgi:hypothetical protein
MRAVTRLRSLRFRSWILPLLLGAFALRVLIPGGFMAVSGAGLSLEAPMCSSVPGRSESLEIPEEAPKTHCDRCLLSPPFEAPYAFVTPGFSALTLTPPLPQQASQVPEAPLARAQSARAPPQA